MPHLNRGKRRATNAVFRAKKWLDIPKHSHSPTLSKLYPYAGLRINLNELLTDDKGFGAAVDLHAVSRINSAGINFAPIEIEG